MKTLIGTITVLVVIGLVGSHLSLAQEPPEVLETDPPEIQAKRERIEFRRKQLHAEREAMRGEAERRAKEARDEMKHAAQGQYVAAVIKAAEDDEDKGRGLFRDYEFDWDQFLGKMPFLRRRLQGHGGHRVLVVPAGKIRPQELLTTMEDMTIMARIITKRLSEEDLIPEVRYDGYGGGRGGYGGGHYGRGGYGGGYGGWGYGGMGAGLFEGSGAIEAIYLDGYGALFVINVDFPLLPPFEKKQQGDTEEPADEVWERAKQEIYSPEDREDEDGDDEEEFDEDKVEELQEELLDTLKHATNIRSLGPDEWVIIAVTGSRESQRHVNVQVITQSRQILVHDKDKKIVSVLGPEDRLPPGVGFRPPAVMTIRVTKSDVDAFAVGQVDVDEFRQKVQAILY
ncbi:MAG: hypothetical protein ACYTEX_10820 [Planctomycetota bacterium]|jgi:hypothetical protein